MDSEWVDVMPVRSREAKTHHETADKLNLYASIQATSEARLKSGDPIFKVADAPDLFDIFLNALPESMRQSWRCTACRKFTQRAGSWVVVDPKTGALIPFAWDPKHLTRTSALREPVAAVVAALTDLEAVRRVDKPLKRNALGRSEAGGFRHMHMTAPASTAHPQRSKAFALTASGELADMLEKVVADNDADTVNEAATLILNDKLPHAAEHKGAIRWLQTLYKNDSLGRAKVGTRWRRNLALHHASAAFTGCIKQLRSGALSTLLEGVREGHGFTQLSAAWHAIANPVAYMRPSADPTEGQVEAAERLFAELGLTREDLRHRFCSWRDIPADAHVWSSAATTAPAATASARAGAGSNSSVFSDVATQPRRRKQAAPRAGAPATNISLARLAADILPGAHTLEVKLPTSVNVYFLVTGEPGTAGLMPWHTRAHQASWYTHARATTLPARGLTPGWTRARALLPLPHLWPATMAARAAGEPLVPVAGVAGAEARHGMRYMIAVEGVVQEEEEEGQTRGVLFPTLLRGELHGVRRVVEAFCASYHVEGPPVPGEFVGGVHVGEDALRRGEGQLEVRVDGTDVYKIVLFA